MSQITNPNTFTSTVVNMTHPKEIMIDYLIKCQFATKM